MDPRAWVEFPFFGEKGTASKGAVSKVQKVLQETQGPATSFKGIPVFTGVIPAATIYNGYTYPGVISGELTVSEYLDGFVKGLNIDTTKNTVPVELLLTANFSDSPFVLEKVSVGSICGTNTGEKYLQLNFPVRRNAVFFWKLENRLANPAEVVFTLPFLEVRR